MQVGIVGAGNISATYVANLHSFEVTAGGQVLATVSAA